MSRIIMVICLLLTVVMAALAAYYQFNNPVEHKRSVFAQRVAGIKPTRLNLDSSRADDLSDQRDRINANKSLWRDLIEKPPPPPPKPPPPPPKPKAPDIAPHLEGVHATRQQIGKKVLFRLPGNPRVFLGVGDNINELVIKKVERKTVTVALPWRGGEVLAELPRD